MSNPATINETAALKFAGLGNGAPSRIRLRASVTPAGYNGLGMPRYVEADLHQLRLEVAEQIAARHHHFQTLKDL